jgi:hypothetical protein
VEVRPSLDNNLRINSQYLNALSLLGEKIWVDLVLDGHLLAPFSTKVGFGEEQAPAPKPHIKSTASTSNAQTTSSDVLVTDPDLSWKLSLQRGDLVDVLDKAEVWCQVCFLHIMYCLLVVL